VRTPGASFGQLSRLVRGLLPGRFALWSAFALVHLWLGLLGLYADGYPLGDISLYRFWADQALFAGHWVGIDTVWVYPVVALVPILIAAVFGTALYASTWLSLVTVLDAAALVAITGLSGEPRNLKIGWWWLGFLLLLGPIALGRIDSVTVPMAIVGVLMIAARPRAAAILLTVAAWIKVWPAAIVAAIVISARTRWRVLAAALGTSAIIVAGALLLGSGTNVFSFVTEQNARGLQFEAPVSTPWLWQAYVHTPGAFAYYDTTLFTWQVHGDGVALVSSLMMPLLLLACTALVLLALLAVTRGADVAAVLPALVLALVSALIVFNKVGSPQFMTWLSVPVILGLAAQSTRRGGDFRVPAVLVLVLAALTQSFYPYLYVLLLGLNPAMLTLLTARNVLVVVLLGYAVAMLWRSRNAVSREQLFTADGDWLPARWPFTAGRDRLDGEHTG
jgi:hypothetical protein